jgi:hypothetical protein
MDTPLMYERGQDLVEVIVQVWQHLVVPVLRGEADVLERRGAAIPEQLPRLNPAPARTSEACPSMRRTVFIIFSIHHCNSFYESS